MSLILDALRKSEAERRRGQLPALALELPPAAPHNGRTGTWWLAIPLVVLAAAATLWVVRTDDQSPARDEVSVTQSGVPSPQELAAEAAPTPGGSADVAGEGFERAMDGARPPLAAGRGLMAANPSPAAAAPPPEAENTAPARTTPSPEQPILALADLTTSERTALPALKLTMHMWSHDPARRFVILDGHRLGEGSRAGNAVVERIDPDGVILAADGRLIRLPLP